MDKDILRKKIATVHVQYGNIYKKRYKKRGRLTTACHLADFMIERKS